jgi:hypothetical protein
MLYTTQFDQLSGGIWHGCMMAQALARMRHVVFVFVANVRLGVACNNQLPSL